MKKNKYFNIVIRIALYYTLILGILYVFQNKVLYHPTEATLKASTWSTFYQNNKPIAIEYKPAEVSPNLTNNLNSVVVIFHGNAGHAADRTHYKGVFPHQHLIILEYPGYGFRFSDTIDQKNLTLAGQELIHEIKKKYPNKHITLLGESLGTGIASEVAVLEHIDQLILITPYTSISEVASDKFWYFPVSRLVRDNYSNVDVLKNYQGKTLILAAERDEVIPAKFAQQLYDQMTGKKTMVFVKNANHTSWVIDGSADDIRALRQFVTNQ